ncbi:MAG: hypothetical protein SPE10_07025 [Paludibacteraceae bacterium]|nr:hypothetical protein [Paludibacteraceae bacterium]
MEKDFLQKLAEAYTKYDASIIEPYLAENMHYASMWVFHEMTSKQEYMDYLIGKLQTMKRTGKTFNFKIVAGRMHSQALLADANCGFVVDFDAQGKVNMLNITAPEFF